MVYIVEDDDNIRQLGEYTLNTTGIEAKGFALPSLFWKKTINPNLAMTGELSLTGQVLPIGGLREKAIAASRSGLKRILIPKENVKDIDDIPESVRNSLEIIPIEDAKEAVEYVLVK